MKKLLCLIVILFNFACSEENIDAKNDCDMSTPSKSLPLEFFPITEASFNQVQAPGINKKCWFNKWNCEDKIKVQMDEESASTHLLLPPDEWTSISGGFTTNGEKTSTSFFAGLMSAGSATEEAYQLKALLNGETFKFKIFASFDGATVPVLSFVMLDGVTETSNTVSINTNGEHEIELVATADSDRVRISIELVNQSLAIVSPQPDVKTWDLRVEDKYGVEIVTEPLVRTPTETTIEITSADWVSAATTNLNGGTQNWGGAGSVTLIHGGPGSITSYLKYIPVSIAGNQRVRLFLEMNASKFGADITASSVTMGLYDEDFNLLASHEFDTGSSATGSYGLAVWFEVELTTNTPVAYVGVFTESTATFSSSSSTFMDYGRAVHNLYPDAASYQITFIPEDEDLCGQMIRFILVEDGEDAYYTDLQDIKTLHKGTWMLNYTNDEYYDGIDYEASGIVFGIRLAGKFYEPDSPEENESEPDSDGMVHKLMSEVKDMTQLVIEPAPPYLFRKLKRVMNHNSLWLANRPYIKEGAVEKEVMDEKFGLYPIKTWLTEQENTFVTNVY